MIAKATRKFFYASALPFVFLACVSAQLSQPAYEHLKSWLGSIFSSPAAQDADKSDERMIKGYFNHFDRLTKAEKWEEIIAQGLAALEAAKRSHRQDDEAKICAQLTSTFFYQGNYDQSLTYAKRCHELSGNFEDPALFIKAVYSESAIYRVLAPKEENEEKTQQSYRRAVDLSQKAADLYFRKGVSNLNLKGKIYFNLGAAHADNPKGDLEEAKSCYLISLECFRKTHAINDIMRVTVRLGRAYLLQNEYELCQKTLDEVRPFISNERLAMHADYLEAELKFALKEYEESAKLAQGALEKARTLGAKEDELRLMAHLQKIESAMTA